MHPSRSLELGIHATATSQNTMHTTSECWPLKEAIADAGLTFKDIDGLIVNRIPDYQRFCEIAGI